MNYGEVAKLMGNSAKEVEHTYGHLEKAVPDLVATIA